jgi:hypothetical protein
MWWALFTIYRKFKTRAYYPRTYSQLKAKTMTAQRITLKFLNAQCERLNRVEGAPLTAYSKEESTGKYTANIGNYHISQAYGGYSLHRITNAGGGVSNPLSVGYVPARELSGLLSAYIAGMNRVLWRLEDVAQLVNTEQQANKTGE